MKFTVSRFEDICPDRSEVHSDAPDSLLDWYRQFCQSTDFFAALPTAQAVPPELHKPLVEVEIIIMSRPDFEDHFPANAHALGLANWAVPDSDPFEDSTPYCEKNRIIIVFDKGEMITRLNEDISLDRSDRHLSEYDFSQAVTLGHEIAHQVLFLANSGGLSFADIECMTACDELDYAASDFITGYGIRPLPIQGVEADAQDAEEASEIMEQWCEEQGRKWTGEFINTMPYLSFYKACGIDAKELATAFLKEQG